MEKKYTVIAEFAGKQVVADAHVEQYSQQECVKKGLSALGFCWATAAICLFVPVIHFVITPIALVAGPIAGLFVFYKVQKLPRLIEGKVPCGHCGKTTSFRFYFKNPRYYEVCENCKTGYEVLWPANEVKS